MLINAALTIYQWTWCTISDDFSLKILSGTFFISVIMLHSMSDFFFYVIAIKCSNKELYRSLVIIQLDAYNRKYLYFYLACFIFLFQVVMLEAFWFLLLALPCVTSQIRNFDSEMRCPEHWVRFQISCYRFIKSPLRNRNDAAKNCQVGFEWSSYTS